MRGAGETLPAQRAPPLMEKPSLVQTSSSWLSVCTHCRVNGEKFLIQALCIRNPSLEVPIYFLGHEGVWMIGSVSPFSVKAGPCRELSQRNRAFLTDLDKRESSAHPETSPTTAKISCSGDLSLCLLKELLSWRTHFRRAFSPQNDF